MEWCFVWISRTSVMLQLGESKPQPSFCLSRRTPGGFRASKSCQIMWKNLNVSHEFYWEMCWIFSTIGQQSCLGSGESFKSCVTLALKPLSRYHFKVPSVGISKLSWNIVPFTIMKFLRVNCMEVPSDILRKFMTIFWEKFSKKNVLNFFLWNFTKFIPVMFL